MVRRSRTLLLPVALMLAGFASAGNDPDELLVEQLDSLMNAHLAGAVRTQAALPRVKRDEHGQWQVELGLGFLSDVHGRQIPAELDARLQAIRLQLLLRQEKRGESPGLSFRFAGQTLEDALGEPGPIQRQRQRRSAAALPAAAPVFVAASHGYYFHGGFNDWRLQRPLANGIIEDLLTPQFADHLALQLQEKGYSTLLARPLMDGTHPESEQPWPQMASRYHAQALLPLRPDIWQNWEDRSIPLREYNDDIRTRPLWANDVGAQVVFHLHTNAAGSDASGTMAFVQPGRSEDRRLGHVVLCSMRAAIQAVPKYAGYRVRAQPQEGNYGENRLSDAPSLLIELGFHTNPEDALALQDPIFQAAATRGIVEGYTAFRAGAGADGGILCD